MADEIALMAKSLGTPSTGNAEQDEARIHSAARSICMIAAGHCPNGCGELIVSDLSQDCFKCGFNCGV